MQSRSRCAHIVSHVYSRSLRNDILHHRFIRNSLAVDKALQPEKIQTSYSIEPNALIMYVLGICFVAVAHT